MENKTTPVNTGKVRIGIYYEPKKRSLSLEETCLQDALLGYRRSAYLSDATGKERVLIAVVAVYVVVSFLFYLVS